MKTKKIAKCPSIIRHGPGHQSTTHCHLTGKHIIHEAYYGSYREFAQWKGDQNIIKL